MMRTCANVNSSFSSSLLSLIMNEKKNYCHYVNVFSLVLVFSPRNIQVGSKDG